jgi:hypothetical protein
MPSNLIDNIILVIRKNLQQFEGDFAEITQQLYKIENMRLAKIPEKYIIQTLIDDNNILIQNLNKLKDDKIVKEIKNDLQSLS